MKPKHKLPPWLKPKALSAATVVGVGWYTEENWKQVKGSAVDADRFEDTYQEWLEMAEASLQNLQAVGVKVTKTSIDAGALLSWCLAHNKENSAASRAEYVSQIAGSESPGGAMQKPA